MSTKKIFVKILNLCAISALIMGISFMIISCTRVGEKNSSTVKNSSGLSTTDATEKDIMTETNKKLFADDYILPYYLNVDMEYKGEITSSEMGDEIFLCSINNNSLVDIDRYKKDDQFIIPQDIGDQIIKNRFVIELIDHNKISFYNAQKKAYIIDSGLFGQGAYVCTIVTSIKQRGDVVIVTVDFVSPDEKTGMPDYSKKLETLKFILKNNNNHYLYEKVEKVWEAKQ